MLPAVTWSTFCRRHTDSLDLQVVVARFEQAIATLVA
jgi:hypothetical protein